MSFLRSAANQLQQRVSDEAECNSIGDAERQRRNHQHQERRERLSEIVPLNIADRFHHQTADYYQCGRGDRVQSKRSRYFLTLYRNDLVNRISAADHLHDRREEQSDEKLRSDYERRYSRSPANCYS